MNICSTFRLLAILLARIIVLESLQAVYERDFLVSVSHIAVPFFHDILMAHLGEHPLLPTVHTSKRKTITEVTYESHNHYSQCNKERDPVAGRKLFTIRLSTDYSSDISEAIDSKN